MIEAVVFVTYAQDSTLKNQLQKAEEAITSELRVPSVRFVERGGRTVSDVLSRNNPWKVEAQCPRTKCPPCWGRICIAAEEERKAMDNVTGKETETTAPRKGSREKKDVALPICTL